MAYLLLSFYITFITIDFTRKSLFHAAKYRNFVAKNKLESINGLESNYANNSTINTRKCCYKVKNNKGFLIELQKADNVMA